MIGRLTGFLLEKIDDKTIILDVSGVGYIIHVSKCYVVDDSTKISFVIFSAFNAHDGCITLYGFCDRDQEKYFKILYKIKGVSAKIAMTIVGMLSISQIYNIVLIKDFKQIKQIPGIGDKLAKRIISEIDLKKLQQLSKCDTTTNNNNIKMHDLLHALERLGYDKEKNNDFIACNRLFKEHRTTLKRMH